MRRLLAALLVVAVGVTSVPVGTVRADEPDPQVVEARRLGRRLLAHDPARRVDALVALIDLLDKAADRRAELLGEATTALAAWADSPVRLEETWLRDAADGRDDARSRAADLLMALKGLSRERAQTAAELQADTLSGTRMRPAETPAPPPSQPTSPELQDLREHRLVDATALYGGDATQLDIRTFLMRRADASQVVDFGSHLWMVLAEPAGHARLAEALAAVARGDDLPTGTEHPPATVPAPTAPQTGAGQSDEAVQEAAETEPAAQTLDTADTQPKTDGPRWRVEAHALVGPAPPANEKDATSPGVSVGAPEVAGAWLSRERKRRDARELRAWATSLIVGAAPVEWLAGREISFNREVVPTGSGAWRVESSTLNAGYAFTVRLLEPEGDSETTRLVVEASRTDVVEPLTEIEIRPAKDAEPLIVHRPTWARTTRTETADLPPEGGVVAIAFDVRTGDSFERMVLLVALTPADH